MNAQLLRRGMGWWPPFLGAGIRVKSIADDDSLVALVRKTLYVRRKPKRSSAQ